MVQDRDGERRAEDRAEVERGQVDRQQHAGTLGVAALDEAREQHVQQRDRAGGDDRPREQQVGGDETADEQADGEDRRRDREDPLLAEAACRRRGEQGEGAEAEQRDRRQQADQPRREAEEALEVEEDRRQAGHRGAEIERQRENADHEERVATPVKSRRQAPFR